MSKAGDNSHDFSGTSFNSYNQEESQENEVGPSGIVDEEMEIDGEIQITDSSDEEEFVRKYGDINFQYIKRPKDAVWFIRPHALNYFKDGVLYRTKGERTSSKTELFLDLMYVGIIANLAGSAAEEATGAAFLQYVLLFIPAWMVWADIKDFTNYYYNEDLSQKLYIMWILVLLTLFSNNHYRVLEDVKGAALTVVPYILCRISLAISLVVYSFFIPQHRPQMRLYAGMIFVTCCLWIPVIFISTRAKIGLSFAILFLEAMSQVIAYHPITKKYMKLTESTALNIEHEVERYGVFVTIAIGEFLYKVVAEGPLGTGLTDKFARGVFLLIIAYDLFWIYQYGSSCKKATHALRHSGWTAIGWMYTHLPLVASLVLAADAGGDLCSLDITSTKKHLEPETEPAGGAHERFRRRSEEEVPNMYGLSFYFTGGICVALICMWLIGSYDRSRDPVDMHVVPRFWRIFCRVPIGIIIVCLSLAELNTTVLMGIVTALLTVLLVYESVVMTPKQCLPFVKTDI
ncbi:hypothetical protein JA9_002891 [Meyerozyma sp. JA9]|nr:hypothetical protein JA9_002891 [Meyerozyma sp. JA9]